MSAINTLTVDAAELRERVVEMYRRVAQEPQAEFHFETGRSLAERLGYPPAELDRVPAEAVDSFAGVGYHLDLAAPREGEVVIDLGSGSGMDAFVAALHVGARGRVIGIDMTDAQLEKAEQLRQRDSLAQVEFRHGYIEAAPVPDASADVVISNGVINLAPDKELVFREIARLLRPGGRVALSDIVSETELPASITCNVTLWAACIGGAAPLADYREGVERAGLRLVEVRENPQYQFLSGSAQGASTRYGVRSVSVLAEKSR